MTWYTLIQPTRLDELASDNAQKCAPPGEELLRRGPVPIQEFAEYYHLTMVVRERHPDSYRSVGRTPLDRGPGVPAMVGLQHHAKEFQFYAYLKGVEVIYATAGSAGRDSRINCAVIGSGGTPEEAIARYAMAISHQVLAVTRKDMIDRTEEITAPALVYDAKP